MIITETEKTCEDGCDHLHLDTRRSFGTDKRGHEFRWVLEDRFFCKKCLNIVTKRKEEVSDYRPSWY